MKPLTKSLQKFFLELSFDKQLVRQIKKANIDQDLLYNYVTNGRITLEEYLHAVK